MMRLIAKSGPDLDLLVERDLNHEVGMPLELPLEFGLPDGSVLEVVADSLGWSKKRGQRRARLQGTVENGEYAGRRFDCVLNEVGAATIDILPTQAQRA